MSEINVLYSFDSKFSKLAAVSIYSLLKNQNKTTHVNLYIMCPPRTREKSRINKIAAQFGANITWRTVRKNPFKNHDYRRWSPVIFYRLFAWREFPDVKRMLYLDSDTLILRDLSELFNTDLGDNVIGGVIDNSMYTHMNLDVVQYIKHFIINYTKGTPYINSGVILMDMDKMRKNYDCFISATIPLRYPDQDLLNYALAGKIKYLDEKYNIPPSRIVNGENKEYSLNNWAIIHCYTAKPYIYEFSLRKLYSLFIEIAHAVGLTQDDFLRNDEKYLRSRYTSRSVIPFVRVTLDKRVYLFGIRVI